MKKFKKIFTVLLATSLSFTGAIPISAQNSAIQLYETNEPEVYLTDSGTYLHNTNTGTFQEVERYEINLYNQEDLLNQLKNLNLTQEVKDDIIYYSTIAINHNNKDAAVVIYAPPLKQSRNSSQYEYTYNGHRMMDQLTYYYNIDTGYQNVVNGINTSSISSAIDSLILGTSGLGSTSISLFALGVSAKDWYKSISGTYNISGSYEDYIQAFVKYDVYKKWTFADRGMGWETGAQTQKVTIKETRMRVYHFNHNGGNAAEYKKNPNVTYKTQNFDNPASIAWQWAGSGGWNEQINAHIYNHSIIF